MNRKNWVMLFIALLIVPVMGIGLLIYLNVEDREYSIPDLVEMFDKADVPEPGGIIPMQELEKYRIIYDSHFTEDEVAKVYQLQDVIQKYTGISLEVHDAAYGSKDDTIIISRHEILIGNVLRVENNYLNEHTWQKGASCAVIGRKLVLTFGEQADPFQILDRFIAVIEENCKQEKSYLFNHETDAFVDTSAAMVQSLYLNDLPITEYTIVNSSPKDSNWYGSSATTMKLFQYRLREICGYELPMQDLEDGTPPTAGILSIGVEPTLDSIFSDLFSPAEESAYWTLYAEGNNISITGVDPYCAAQAVDALISRLTPAAPTEYHSVQVGKEKPVKTQTNISLLRVDFSSLWQFESDLMNDIYHVMPDIVILERGEEVSIYDETFSKYYSEAEKTRFETIYYCSSRFELVDQGEINIPDGASYEQTLHSDYWVLKDLMTWDEIVIYQSDVKDETLELFEKTQQYLCFPDKHMIYWGYNVPDAVNTLFAQTVKLGDDGMLCTLLTDGMLPVEIVDYSDEINDNRCVYEAVEGNKCEAQLIHLQFEKKE